MELLEKMAALGIEQRKMLREQRELLVLQKEMCSGVSELKAGLAELKAGHRELMEMMEGLNERLEATDQLLMQGGGNANEGAKVWLDACEVKELLLIGDITLRRRRNDGSFVSKKIGKKWFYLRSSLQ